VRRFLTRRVLGRLALGVVGLVIGGLAVSALREATLSTHQAVDPDSTIEVVLRASSHAGEQDQTLAEQVEAHLMVCRLEVTSDMVGNLLPSDPHGEVTTEVEEDGDASVGDAVDDVLEGELLEDDGGHEGFFRATFAPSMDQTNRRQFRGCVEDFSTDHLQVDIVELREPTPQGAGPTPDA
jgi:hypothetical protein